MKSNSNVPLELMNELYRSYDFFNGHFCENKLPRPILLIARSNKKKAFGWFSGNAWNLQKNSVSEITLEASSFKNGTDEVFDTLLHEMAHLKNFHENENKVIDCTEAQRHNQIFKAAAEHFGLTVTKSTRFGFGHTALGETAKVAIKALKPNTKLFALYAEMQLKDKKDKKESKLTPTMVDKDTKAAIVAAAESMGISQKEVVSSAVTLLIKMPDLISTLAEQLFGKKFKTVDDMKAVITAHFTKSEPNEKTKE